VGLGMKGAGVVQTVHTVPRVCCKLCKIWTLDKMGDRCKVEVV
jgi:hypothetical protein